MTMATKRAQSREGRDRRLAAELAALLLDSEDTVTAAPARQPKPRRSDLPAEHAAASRLVLEARLAGDAGLEREARREAALTGAAVLNAAHRKSHLITT